jgi:periplasmic divalent cation tolerance protein
MLEVHVTFPNSDEANAISRAAVEQRLAACANVQARMHSFYWWDGKVQSEDEVPVVFKTADRTVDALVAYIGERHSYSVPAIVVHRPVRTAVSYEEWVNKETRV